MNKFLALAAATVFALALPIVALAAAKTQATPQAAPQAAPQGALFAAWSSPQTIEGHAVLGTIGFTATAYGPSAQDNYPYGATDYFGQPLIAGDVAVDPNVIPLGTRLWVTGYSSKLLPAGGFLARAVDEGNAIQGHRIDLFIDGSEATVSNFGIQHVTVYILKN